MRLETATREPAIHMSRYPCNTNEHGGVNARSFVYKRLGEAPTNRGQLDAARGLGRGTVGAREPWRDDVYAAMMFGAATIVGTNSFVYK
jgi:hypothetical protein